MALTQADGAAVLRRVNRRLMPFLFFLYVFAYLDRVNVGFAALSIRRDLHFSDTVYGTGAGLFFLSYALFEVPANLVLLRVGPRRWIAAIMTVWGIVSSCMVLVHSAAGFYTLRFLLGAAEAGFFPGIVLYLTYWFPAANRARAVAQFMAATAVAGVVGAPLSTALLALSGRLGLAGWQWLFLGEGIPSVVLGLVVVRALVDTPRDATWLTVPEREWLSGAVVQEQPQQPVPLSAAFTSGMVWVLAFLYFSISVALYSLSLWMPLVLKRLSAASDLHVVALTTVPYLLAALAMLLVAHSSDRMRERRWHLTACLLVAAAAFGISAGTHSPHAAMAAIFVAAAGIWGGFGPFWALPTSRLHGRAAAGGIALINSVGALGGFAGPYLMGRVSDLTHSFRAAFYATAVLLLLAALTAAFMKSASGDKTRAPVQ